MQGAPLASKDFRANWNQPVQSSKGTLLQDYTRPEKRSMIGGRDENVNPNVRGIQPFARQYEKIEKGAKQAAPYQQPAEVSNTGQNEARASGAFGGVF